MDFSVTYLLVRFVYRIYAFFHHWYIDGSAAFGRRLMASLAAADRLFALRVTIRHFFEPLYKDYTIVGRILGVIFRTGRLAIGAIADFAIAGCFILAYALWLAVPFLTLYYAAKTF